MRVIYRKLPYPSSGQHRHGRNKITGRTFLTKSAVEYYKLVKKMVIEQNQGQFLKSDRLRVVIKFWQGDKRKRDIDNMIKTLLDALQNAGAIIDDGQIDQMIIERVWEKLTHYVDVSFETIGADDHLIN
ncbi:MAG: RusA family crossover junction endodeoxyribonuclease [Desulfamplus sp.]